MRSILATILLTAVALPALGQTPMKPEQTFHRSVQDGQELRVFTYSRWHRDCGPEDPPRVVLRTSPAHGTASLRAGTATVREVRNGSAACIGKTYPGMGVWYVPAAGFHGVDRFEWDVIDESGISHDTVVVTVK